MRILEYFILMIFTSTTAQIVADQKRYFNIKEQKGAKVTNIEIGNSITNYIILFKFKFKNSQFR